MVSQHEIRIWRHHHIRIRSVIVVSPRYVIFDQLLAVEVHAPIFNANMVPGNSDYAFDKTLRRIAWIPEYYDVAVLDRLNAINEFVDEDALLIVQRGHHAG